MIQVKNNLRYSRCPLCTSIDIFKIGIIEYFSPIYYSTESIAISFKPEFWRCKACDSGFVQNAISESESISLYSQGNAQERWSSAHNFEQSKTQIVVKTLDTLLQKRMRVLDIGCNTGELLDFAKQRECETHGVEYSVNSLEILRNKGHLTYSSLSELDGYFDVITAFDLVEHLYDLPSFLSLCLDRLTPDGNLILLTGSINCLWAKLSKANWWYMRYPEHIVFPSEKYFVNHPNFEVCNWVKTYASPGYEKLTFSSLKGFIKSVLTRNYTGLPALSPDHALILLKRKVSISEVC